MDTPPSDLLTAIAEPLGLAGLFALAIWAGFSLVRAGVAAWKDIAMARIQVDSTMATALAEALRQQAAQGAAQHEQLEGIGRAIEQHTIAVRLMAQRVGMGWDTGRTNDSA